MSKIHSFLGVRPLDCASCSCGKNPSTCKNLRQIVLGLKEETDLPEDERRYAAIFTCFLAELEQPTIDAIPDNSPFEIVRMVNAKPEPVEVPDEPKRAEVKPAIIERMRR